MIVDCFTHTWESASQLGRSQAGGGSSASSASSPAEPVQASASHHLAAAEPVDRTFVLGFVSHYLAADLSNDRVAAYVREHSDCMLGFAGVDPSKPKEAVAELHRAHDELGMVGLAVAPAAQDFHPSDSHAMLVYAEAARCKMPIIFHTGVNASTATKLHYAQPVLLDEVARELPELKLVIAHMGYPWMHETVALLDKHANVFAEISWLLHRPWQAYQALLSAHHGHVMDKLLFGSGFPLSSAALCIEALYGMNHLVHTTNLPTIPREQLRGIVERDALSLLGLSSNASHAIDGRVAAQSGDAHEDE